ncbi:MAG: hypothetical protein U9N40_03055 [Euryarchaeota archaeon]|nr:hypothetical protein [Euryarchaeota archaeon]
MKLSGKIALIFVLFFISSVIVMPCLAASMDIRIPIPSSTTGGTYVYIDNNLVATYVTDSSPPAIKVYYADGSLYKSIPLSNETSDIESLQISDNRIYYTEYDKSIIWTSRTKTVYEYNMSTDKRRPIHTSVFFNNVQPNIQKIVADGDHVVLCEEYGGDDIILHTLSTGTDQTIFRSRSMIHGFAIDGDRIMWGCERTDREPGREIHVYTISTGEDYIIPESKSIRTWGYGDISGDMIVWSKTAEEPDTSLGYPSITTVGSDIQMTDLTTGNTISLEILNTPSTPYISGNMVVFVKKPKVDYNNTNTGTIRVYDIETGEFGDDVGSDVAGMSDFDNGLVIWHRYSPRSEWLTSISGTIPTPTQTNTQNTTDAPQSTPAQESPVDIAVITSALIISVAGYALLRNKQ